MQLSVYCLTDVGLKRSNNQDSYLVDHDVSVYIVADGMGGHKGGEVASAIAVKTVQETVQKSDQNDRGVNPRELLQKAYMEASHNIFDYTNKDTSLRGMGTTMVAAIYRDGVLYIGNVGDSRAYLFSKGFFWQITEDHSVIAEQLRAGLITEDQLDKITVKNVITRSVGYERDVICDVIERRLDPEDLILICSDGLSGMVDDAKIHELILSVPAHRLVSRLIEEAKRNGGDDNITALLIHAAETKAE